MAGQMLPEAFWFPDSRLRTCMATSIEHTIRPASFQFEAGAGPADEESPLRTRMEPPGLPRRDGIPVEPAENEALELLLALESRERGTHLHSLRVQAFAMVLGECCGYRGAALAQLGYGALLHDVGKILIPDSLLLKPGRLSEQEMRIVQQHPSRGYQFLWRFPHLREAAVLALCHHERMDGAGYPLRLCGQEIPLGARITMVADALDVILSGRSYSPARSLAAAHAEILRCAGTQFDQDVVDVFLQVPDEQWRCFQERVSFPMEHSASLLPALP